MWLRIQRKMKITVGGTSYPQLDDYTVITLLGDKRWLEREALSALLSSYSEKKPSECRTVFLQKEQRAVLTALWAGPCKRAPCWSTPLSPSRPFWGSLAFGRQQVSSGDPPRAACVLVEWGSQGQPSCQLEGPPSSVNVWASDQLALLLSWHWTEMPHTFCLKP